MAHLMQPRNSFDLFADTSSSEDDHVTNITDSSSGRPLEPLSELSASNAQNLPPRSNEAVDRLIADLSKFHLSDPPQISQFKPAGNWKDKGRNRARPRLRRPSIGPNTFEVLETVPEDEKHGPSDSTTAGTSNDKHKQQYLELPGVIFSLFCRASKSWGTPC